MPLHLRRQHRLSSAAPPSSPLRSPSVASPLPMRLSVASLLPAPEHADSPLPALSMALTASQVQLTNEQTTDGCFAGAAYYTAVPSSVTDLPGYILDVRVAICGLACSNFSQSQTLSLSSLLCWALTPVSPRMTWVAVKHCDGRVLRHPRGLRVPLALAQPERPAHQGAASIARHLTPLPTPPPLTPNVKGCPTPTLTRPLAHPHIRLHTRSTPRTSTHSSIRPPTLGLSAVLSDCMANDRHHNVFGLGFLH